MVDNMLTPWQTLPNELRFMILKWVVLDMVIGFVPLPSRAQRRKNKRTKWQRQPVFNLLMVSKSFLTVEEFKGFVFDVAIFRYRMSQQFSILDLRFQKHSVERIKRLYVKTDGHRMGWAPMPPRQFRNRLSNLQTFTVEIFPGTPTWWQGHRIDIGHVAELACTGTYSRVKNGSAWGSSAEDQAEYDLESLSRCIDGLLFSHRPGNAELVAWLTRFLRPTLREPYERVVRYAMRFGRDTQDFRNWDFEFGSALPFLRLVYDPSVVILQKPSDPLVRRLPALAVMKKVEPHQHLCDIPSWVQLPEPSEESEDEEDHEHDENEEIED